MKLALREMWRRPARFVTATIILSLIALLLMFLGGLLDGLVRNSTGAVRAQRGDVIVFSSDSKDSFLRSTIDAELRSRIEAVPGVDRTGGIGIIQLGARVPGKGVRDLADTALFGYEVAPRGVPDTVPPLGQAYADSTLKASDVDVGMTILLGPRRTPITVIGFVDDTNYLGQSSLWASPATWRQVVSENRSVEALADGTFQSLLVAGDGSLSASKLSSAIDAATSGTTRTLSIDAAANAIPGVKEQTGTFNQILGVTVVIALAVVGMFFALLTVERTGLYGVLKALGAGNARLFGGVMAQAVLVALMASAIAAVLGFIADMAIPPGTVPFELGVARVILSTVLMAFAAVIGCVFSLKRVLRVDPASAIGAGV